MATNNSSQTPNSNTNTFHGDGYSQAMNYYQVVLVKGNRILLGSNIFNNFDDVEKLRQDINSADTQFVVNYVTAIPNLGYLNSHLQRNYRTESGFFSGQTQHTAGMVTPQKPIPDPELHVQPVAPPRPTRNNSNFNRERSPSPVDNSVRASTSGSSNSESNYPLPHRSFYSNTPSLEVVGESIPNPQAGEDAWQHLDGNNMFESFVEGDDLFSGMKISEYGKGYLLTPPEGHDDIGIKYYHNAWWMPNQNAWFFKEEFLDYFLDKGALWKLEEETIDDLLAGLDSPITKIFDDMSFEPYSDKGYLLQCYNTHENYGDKHFHGGTWHRQGDGWFFPADMRQFLEDNGAEFEYDESHIFDGMDFHNGTKKGQYYLVPEIDSKYYGLDGFEGGQWCHQFESWIFNDTNMNYFTSRGANFTSWH